MLRARVDSDRVSPARVFRVLVLLLVWSAGAALAVVGLVHAAKAIFE